MPPNCPFCNRPLADCTDAFVQKHLARCRKRLNPYHYSDRKRGRPRKEEVEAFLKKRDEEMRGR